MSVGREAELSADQTRWTGLCWERGQVLAGSRSSGSSGGVRGFLRRRISYCAHLATLQVSQRVLPGVSDLLLGSASAVLVPAVPLGLRRKV